MYRNVRLELMRELHPRNCRNTDYTVLRLGQMKNGHTFRMLHKIVTFFFSFRAPWFLDVLNLKFQKTEKTFDDFFCLWPISIKPSTGLTTAYYQQMLKITKYTLLLIACKWCTKASYTWHTWAIRAWSRYRFICSWKLHVGLHSF